MPKIKPRRGGGEELSEEPDLGLDLTTPRS